MTEALGPSNDIIPPSEFRLAERIARVEAKNKRFQDLPPARKRVAIAKDVLKWLATGKLLVPGAAVSTYMEGFAVSEHLADRTIVNGGTCTACAIGGIVACAVERGEAGGSLYRNGLLVGMSQGSPDIHAALSGIFSVEQLCLIEAAFEGEANTPYRTRLALLEERGEHLDEEGDRVWSATARERTSDLLAPAYAFTERYEDRSERMVAIMQNIIANGGTFVP